MNQKNDKAEVATEAECEVGSLVLNQEAHGVGRFSSGKNCAA